MKEKITMHHHHNHSLHTFCIATLLYNIFVIIAEVILQIVLTPHDLHDVVSFEVKVQLFHFVGIIGLGLLQWWIMHKIKHQTTAKFATISFVLVVIHMIVLHLLPRILGIVVEEHHSNEWQEFSILIGIVVFVSMLFWKREKCHEEANSSFGIGAVGIAAFNGHGGGVWKFYLRGYCTWFWRRV